MRLSQAARAHFIAAVSVLLAALFSAPAARAAEENSVLQFHGRVGMISSAYSGPQIGSGTFSLPNAIDLEAEYFVTNKRSFALRTILGLDQKNSASRYSYTGIGERFYVFSRGLSEELSSDGLLIKTEPRWRFYLGIDAGVSQVLVIQLNSILGTYASLIEASASAGAIYQVSHDVGIEAHLGYGMGVGYTNVSATSTNMRFLLGVTLNL